MKLFVLLLSILVLTLNSVPCCTWEDSGTDHYTHENSHNEDECYQVCSPFYTCGTCVGFTTINYLAVTFVVYMRPIQHNSIYLPFELPQAILPIWQPPQLS